MTAIEIAGDTVHFDDVAGPPDAPVIVWIHGFLLAAESYAEVAAGLPDHRHIVPDLRGHGRSAAASDEATMSRMADDVWELTRHLGVERFVVVGHSMGNAVGLRLVARHPESVVAAVSLAGIPVAGKRPDARGDVAGMVDVAGDPVALAGALAGLFVHEAPDSPMVARSGELAAMVPRAAVETIVTEQFFLDDADELLPTLDQPWLFVVPGADGAEPPEYQAEQARRFPDHRVVVLDGEGHMVPQERPALVAETVDAFLREVS